LFLKLKNKAPPGEVTPEDIEDCIGQFRKEHPQRNPFAKATLLRRTTRRIALLVNDGLKGWQKMMTILCFTCRLLGHIYVYCPMTKNQSTRVAWLRLHPEQLKKKHEREIKKFGRVRTLRAWHNRYEDLTKHTDSERKAIDAKIDAIQQLFARNKGFYTLFDGSGQYVSVFSFENVSSINKESLLPLPENIDSHAQAEPEVPPEELRQHMLEFFAQIQRMIDHGNRDFAQDLVDSEDDDISLDDWNSSDEERVLKDL
jgi:hypothetical protein